MNTMTLFKAQARNLNDDAGESSPKCAPAWRAPFITLALGLAACLLLHRGFKRNGWL